MSSREWNELERIVQATAKTLQNNEKYFVEVLSVRASKLAQSYPNDQTVVGLYNFLNKRASSGTIFITREELSNVYNKLYTPNNKFSKVFAKELGITEKTASYKMTRDPKEGQNLLNSVKTSETVLAQELKTAFDATIPYKPYSEEISKLAIRSCAIELNCLGVLPKQIETVAGTEEVILCNAVYETPRGKTGAIIPVEIRNNKALLPTVLLTREGFVKLNTENVNDHIRDTAGNQLKVNVAQILNAVLLSKNGVKPLNDVERAVIKNAQAKDPTNEAVKVWLKNIKKPEPSPDIQTFADKLSSVNGMAEFVHTKDMVEKGRNYVLFVMGNAGYKNAQTSVANYDKQTIYYAVSVDGDKGFVVPVKIANNKVQEPKVLICSDGVQSLTPAGISKVLASGTTDQNAVAITSSNYDLPPDDLLDHIKNSVLKGNYKEAEDCLNVLKQTGNEKAFRLGFSIYRDGLILKKNASSKEVETGCKSPVKTASSKYLICSHTGLPIHKVYQDEQGYCHPLYRRDLKVSGEGAYFMHSKIFSG